MDLTQHATRLHNELGIRMIAICHEKLGAEEFLKEYWPSGELWIDTERGFYSAIASVDICVSRGRNRVLTCSCVGEARCENWPSCQGCS